MDAQAEQLFAPGAGATPPALTGRGEEQAVLSRCLAAMAGGKAPAHDVVLVGPRGGAAPRNGFALLPGDRQLAQRASVSV